MRSPGVGGAGAADELEPTANIFKTKIKAPLGRLFSYFTISNFCVS